MCRSNRNFRSFWDNFYTFDWSNAPFDLRFIQAHIKASWCLYFGKDIYCFLSYFRLSSPVWHISYVISTFFLLRCPKGAKKFSQAAKKCNCWNPLERLYQDILKCPKKASAIGITKSGPFKTLFHLLSQKKSLEIAEHFTAWCEVLLQIARKRGNKNLKMASWH